MKTYAIDKISDLLAVPNDRRSACLRQLQYALELHEFTYGEQASEVPFTATWTDDGIYGASILADGTPFVTLSITGAAIDAGRE